MIDALIVCWLIDSKQPCRKDAAQAKLVAAETFQFVTDRGMQILASAGYSADSDMQRYRALLTRSARDLARSNAI